ncbi:nicotinamide riboside transporter PnuC [Ectopseudomonas hydrolytica]|jgi:nicotinamide mononucleotide transporter|uniref:Nicotinamide riboside transporter PnuC n=1 Tax=Ectopseudomonas mendocina (strain ymp) TaxID=399739 RepID=A4XUB6_ECTM1|nr:nicotinamide riboside transporter PnuC [Pseudomonas hydrolytica]MBF8162661.1 nicotinamide mononucleotide transporter [Pseudomonas mendocina]UTH29417.1 nicotinamide riboside transporter PnuC [Pseudomonas hydrolytica]UZZ08454.1 nicotinamide riboside transporter PnuC [Pseudomonas mendocina]
MSWLELIAAGLGILAVWLTVRQNPWCWPIGLIMVLLYAWLFYDWRLYSNLLLQVLFAALQLYGWWQWTRGGERHDGRTVSRLRPAGVLTGLLAGSIGALALGYLMATHTDASSPWLDAALTAFSLVAQLWMAQKRLQCWVLWVVVDLCYVAFFLHSGLYLTAALYAAFTLLAISGWLSWRRDPAIWGSR